MVSAVSMLDGVIMQLLKEREVLCAASEKGGEPESLQGAGRIFTSPFLQAGSARAQAYQPLLEVYSIGFEAERKPVIYLRQENKLDSLLSPPDHHFVFTMSVAESNHTGWITLEREVGTFDTDKELAVSVALKMSAESPVDMRLELHVPVEGQDSAKINLKDFSLKGGGVYETISVSSMIDLRKYGVPDSVKQVSPKLILFFPPDKVGTYRLAYQTFLASE